jgi:hypothetical protein
MRICVFIGIVMLNFSYFEVLERPRYCCMNGSLRWQWGLSRAGAEVRTIKQVGMGLHDSLEILQQLSGVIKWWGDDRNCVVGNQLSN